MSEMLPREVIENILYLCDGPTLCSALQVSSEWCDIIDYLDKKFHIWRKICKADIPAIELREYESKSSDAEMNWKQTYINRHYWKDIKENIVFETNSINLEGTIKDPVCLAVCKDLLIVAFETGTLATYKEHSGCWKEEVSSKKCLRNGIVSLHTAPAHESVVARCRQLSDALVVCDLFTDRHQYLDDMWYVECLEIYRNIYASINSDRANLTLDICQSCPDHRDIQQVELPMLNNTYNMRMIQMRLINENTCVVFQENNVVILVERERSGGEFIVKRVKKLEMAAPTRELLYVPVGLQDTIINENVIITRDLVSEADNPQVIRVSFPYDELDGIPKPTKRLLPQKVFGTIVSCMHLHGNTLIMGTHTGWLYFYAINGDQDWDNLDLWGHSHALEISRTFGPIKSISVLEMDGQRSFYILSDWGRISLVTGRAKVT